LRCVVPAEGEDVLKKLGSMPIRWRLPAAIAVFVATAMTIMGWLLYSSAAEMKREMAHTTMEVLAKDQAARVRNWFDDIENHLAATAASPLPAKAIGQLNWALSQDGEGLERIKSAYVSDTSRPLGQREVLTDAADGSIYSAAHARIHPEFRDLLEAYGYYDLFLFNLSGDLIYTVVKENDFAENFSGGPLAGTGLGRVFAQSLEAPEGAVSVVDFRAYAPSNDAPAGFMGTPVFNPDGRRVGVLAYQLPIDGLAEMLARASALGEHGDMYIVGSDGMARTGSRFDGRFDPLDTLPAVSFLTALQAGETGFFDGVTGVGGAASLGYTRDVGLDWADWTIVAELDEAEFQQSLVAFRNTALVYVCLGLVIATAVSFIIARSITRPLQDAMTSMHRIADGDHEAQVKVAERGDEIGDLGRTLVEFRDRLAASGKLEEKGRRDMEAQERVTGKIADALAVLADGDLTGTLDERFPYGFEPIRANFNKTVATLHDMLGGVLENSREIHTRAEDIAGFSDDLSDRTERQAGTLKKTAAALDHLTGSVSSAADRATQVEDVVQTARSRAESNSRVVTDAVNAMDEIKRSSERISQMIGLIDDIAFQTNLLALNAGVEASRAGDAGRGFAVVASEVRSLAQTSVDTAKKIKDTITDSTCHVESGVDLVNRAGQALEDVVAQVVRISEFVSEIASCAQEQSARLAEVNTDMSQLDRATQENAMMVKKATTASVTLKREVDSLRRQVARFGVRGDAGKDAEAMFVGQRGTQTATPMAS
jgi:methyl-accepting chemotaxis protein